MISRIAAVCLILLANFVPADARITPRSYSSSPHPVESLKVPDYTKPQDGIPPTFKPPPALAGRDIARQASSDLKEELAKQQPRSEKVIELLEEMKSRLSERKFDAELSSILGSSTDTTTLPIDAASPNFLVRRPRSKIYDPLVREVLSRKIKKLSHLIDRDQVLSLSFVSSIFGRREYDQRIPLAKRLRGRLADRLTAGHFDTLDGHFFAAARGKTLVITGHVEMQPGGPAFEIRREDNTFRYVSFAEIDAASRRFEFSVVLLGCGTGRSAAVGPAEEINDITAITNLDRAMHRHDVSTLQELISDLSSHDLQFLMSVDRPDDGTLVPFDLVERKNPTSSSKDSGSPQRSQGGQYGAAGGGGAGGSGGSGIGSSGGPSSSGGTGAMTTSAPVSSAGLYWGQTCATTEDHIVRSIKIANFLNNIKFYFIFALSLTLIAWWVVSFFELSRRAALPVDVRSKNIMLIFWTSLALFVFYSLVYLSNFDPVTLLIGTTPLAPSVGAIIFISLAVSLPFLGHFVMRAKMPDHIWAINAAWGPLIITTMPIILQIFLIAAASGCAIIPTMPMHAPNS